MARFSKETGNETAAAMLEVILDRSELAKFSVVYGDPSPEILVSDMWSPPYPILTSLPSTGGAPKRSTSADLGDQDHPLPQPSAATKRLADEHVGARSGAAEACGLNRRP